MKCIHCGSDSKYKERKASGGRCSACKHSFAFEPVGGAQFGTTDVSFQKAIETVSAKGTVFFTASQLWYEWNRRRRSSVLKVSNLGAAGVAVTFFGGVFGLVTRNMALLAGGASVGGALMAAGFVRYRSRRAQTPRPLITLFKFRSEYLSRWQDIHGKLDRLAPPPAPLQLHAGAAPDLTSYSFDRALITDTDEMAAMLVANNFHFENNCAILSVAGYPGPLSDTILTMLRRNPRLTVFAVHDAAVDGLLLPSRLRASWFPDPAIRIVDLGLRPADAQKLNMISLQEQPVAIPSVLTAMLSPAETTWLAAGNHTELAALRPARLMRAIYQGFARANQIGTDTGDGGTGMIWFHDSNADIYAADSFG